MTDEQIDSGIRSRRLDDCRTIFQKVNVNKSEILIKAIFFEKELSLHQKPQIYSNDGHPLPE